MTFDEQAAKVRGVRTKLYDYILNILSAIAVVVGVNLMGVVLVTALMIIPATFAKSVAKKFSQVIPISIYYSTILTLTGIILSYYLDSPSGATIVIVQTAGLIVGIGGVKLVQKNR